MQNKIKQLFRNCNIHLSASLYYRIKQIKKSNPEVIQWCQKYLNLHPEFQKISYLIICICQYIDLPKCKNPNCKNIIKYRKSQIFHVEYCCKHCVVTDENYIKKLSQIKKQCCKNPQILYKRQKTMLKRYGVSNISKLQSIKHRKIQTCRKNFGVDFPMQNKEVLKKSAQTNLKLYGVKHVSQRSDIKQKKKLKLYTKTFKYFQRYKKYIEPAFTFQEFLEKGYHHQCWKCTKCGKIFYQDHYYFTNHIEQFPWLPRCLNCFPLNQKHSHAQDSVVNFLKTIYLGKILTTNRQLIAPKQLDIVLPQLKLAIEFNGNFWHENKPAGYHLGKTQSCQKLGYRLIHIWQDEWRDNQNLVKNKLKDIINNKHKIFKRKTLILDRCWYSSKQEIKGYKLIDVLPPKYIQRDEFLVENCGYLKFWKIN